MRRRIPVALLLIVCLAAAAFVTAPTGASARPLPRAPKGFFGIGPQSTLTDKDAEYMVAGGIESVRWPVSWAGIQPTRTGGYDWASLDETVAVASRNGLQLLPFLLGTPRWVAGKETTLPINNATARSAWTKFLEAAVKRYGPGGEFWKANPPGVSVNYQPAIPKAMPIRSWQVWNEANFFYFAYPVSPQRYGQLLKISSPAIKRIDPGAKVILTGLFGAPTAGASRGMPAAQFLEGLYRIPGIKSDFDGVALHPYAVDTETLEELVEELHEVTVENHDRVPLYITEMGWGSQNDFHIVAFEQGVRGQVEELEGAYAYLLENRNRLDLKQVYWFSWKDVPGSCSFCDSVGLFHAGPRFRPKLSWRAFVGLTGGSLRP
ncbi:MAG: beta-galactosidase [Solirubrobacterales bacterium]|nr:beta-galactosidase [Solirubrobacterales bacterium]